MATRSLATTQQTLQQVLEPAGGVAHLGAEDANGSAPIGRRTEEWQRDAWKFYDTHGEVHYPLTVGANLAARIDIGVSRRVDGGWVEATSPAAMMALDNVVMSGVDDYWRSLWLNTGIAGEGVLVIGDQPGSTYSIEIFSNDEVYQEGDGRWVRVDDMGRREYLTGYRVTRFWRNHPRYRRKADSGLRSVLNECRELELLKLSLLAKITSRLASVGILYIPNSISLPTANASDGTLSGDPLIQVLQKLFMAPLRNPGSAAASMPIMLRGPEDAGEKIRHIVLDTKLDEVEERHRVELRAAIAQGIELPIETQTQVSDSNHWNAWHVSESALNDHVLPICRAGAALLTTRILWPTLRLNGVPEQEVRAHRFHADPSRAALGLNQADLSRQLFDRGEVNGAWLRQAHGVDEAYKPTEIEFIRFLGIKMNNPLMATYGLREKIPPEILSGPSPPGIGGFDAPAPMVDGGQLPGNPNTGLQS